MVQDSKIKVLFDCYKVPVLVLLTLFVRFMPYGLQQVAFFHTILLPINIFVVCCSLFIVSNHWDIDRFQVCLLLFVVIQVLSNTINGVETIRKLWHLVLPISMVIVLIWAIKTDEEKCIKIVSWFFLTVLAANLFTILFFKEGPFELSDGSKFYLLGNHNSYIQPAIILLLFLGIGFYDEKDRKWIIWCITWLVLLLTYYKERSVTSIIGLTLLFLYVLLLNREFTRSFLNIVTYTIANAAVFAFVIINHITESEKLQSVLEMVKKSPTLSSRTMIWDEYAGIISKSLLLGFGNLEQGALRRVFGNTPAGGMPHAHNLILNTAFQYGLIGLAALILVFVVVAIELRSITNIKLRFYFEAIFGIILLMSQFEMYSFEFYYMVLTLMFAYARKERIENAKPMLTKDF